MNNLCADIGYRSLNHFGEELCGDHIDVVEQDENSCVIVLADGLGSGVKASILSTLTSRIISTMLAAGLSLADCVETIAATLPVCSKCNVAYSTFTILHLVNNEEADMIQYDNPMLIMLRDGVRWDYPCAEMNIGGKKIYRSHVRLQEGDIFLAMSDGCTHAGMGTVYNFGWEREDIIRFAEQAVTESLTAKALANRILAECSRLYDGRPADDATVCAVRIRRREPVSILFGPPSKRDDSNRMMALFFAKEGRHIVCGGSTGTMVAGYLRKPIRAKLDFSDPEIPPTAEIEGVDLVTEGVITINRVLSYASDYLNGNCSCEAWADKTDGASLIARLLFEEATDISFFVGRAINPAHQNPSLPINFSIKMQLVANLSECLRKMGKRVKISYF